MCDVGRDIGRLIIFNFESNNENSVELSEGVQDGESIPIITSTSNCLNGAFTRIDVTSSDPCSDVRGEGMKTQSIFSVFVNIDSKCVNVCCSLYNTLMISNNLI